MYLMRSPWLMTVICLPLIELQRGEGADKVRRLQGHTAAVRAVAFTPDGKTLISGGWDKKLLVWDLASGKETTQVNGQSNLIVGVALSPTGKTALLGDYLGRMVHVWDLAKGKELHKLIGHENYVHGVAFSPDGKIAASASFDQTIILWDVLTGKELRRLKGHLGYVNTVAFSSDGKLLASGGADLTVRIWDPKTGKELHKLAGHKGNIISVAFSPDGKSIASAAHDETVRLWEVITASERCVLQGHKGWVRCAAFSPDGNTLVSAGQDKIVRLWDTTTGKELTKLEGHQGIVWTVAFSPNGNTVASGSDDFTIRLWDVSKLVHPKTEAAEELSDKALGGLWEDLGGRDAEKAFRAISKLSTVPEQSPGFLEKSLLKQEKAPLADQQRVARLIAALNADDFKVRDQAAAELAALGVTVKAALVKALQETRSSEVGYRLRGLLKLLKNTPPGILRIVRGVELLEHIGGQTAQQALTKLSKEGKEPRLKQEAKAALDRLVKVAGGKQ
jgi:sugar lactone lactonase YvrE